MIYRKNFVFFSPISYLRNLFMGQARPFVGFWRNKKGRQMAPSLFSFRTARCRDITSSACSYSTRTSALPEKVSTVTRPLPVP